MRKTKNMRIATKRKGNIKYLQSKISYNLDEYKKVKYKTSNKLLYSHNLLKTNIQIVNYN